MKNTKLLVVVDESRATKRALKYVARVASRRRDFRVCLAHALPSPPPELVEMTEQRADPAEGLRSMGRAHPQINRALGEPVRSIRGARVDF
jgi:hypothetical protein